RHAAGTAATAISNSDISGVTESSLDSASLTLHTTGTTVNLADTGAATIDWTNVDFDGTLNTGGSSATISGGASIESLSIGGPVTLNKHNTINAITAVAGALVKLEKRRVGKEE